MFDELSDDEPDARRRTLLETVLKPILGLWIRKRMNEGASKEQILAKHELFCTAAELSAATGVKPGQLGQA